MHTEEENTNTTERDRPTSWGDAHVFTSNYRGDKLEDWTRFSWGTFERNPKGKYYVPSELSGSDYSGGPVEAANFKVFLESHKDQLGVSMWELYGDYGTYGIAVDYTLATDEMVEELNSLESYCILDEDAMSELEYERETEAWDDYLASDFKRALGKKFTSEEDELILDEMEDGTLYELFHKAMETTNTYYEHETGGTVYVDLDRLVAGVESLSVEEEGN
jgi:hypothetical protein